MLLPEKALPPCRARPSSAHGTAPAMHRDAAASTASRLSGMPGGANEQVRAAARRRQGGGEVWRLALPTPFISSSFLIFLAGVFCKQ